MREKSRLSTLWRARVTINFHSNYRFGIWEIFICARKGRVSKHLYVKKSGNYTLGSIIKICFLWTTDLGFANEFTWIWKSRISTYLCVKKTDAYNLRIWNQNQLSLEPPIWDLYTHSCMYMVKNMGPHSGNPYSLESPIFDLNNHLPVFKISNIGTLQRICRLRWSNLDANSKRPQTETN